MRAFFYGYVTAWWSTSWWCLATSHLENEETHCQNVWITYAWTSFSESRETGKRTAWMACSRRWIGSFWNWDNCGLRRRALARAVQQEARESSWYLENEAEAIRYFRLVAQDDNDGGSLSLHLASVLDRIRTKITLSFSWWWNQFVLPTITNSLYRQSPVMMFGYICQSVAGDICDDIHSIMSFRSIKWLRIATRIRETQILVPDVKWPTATVKSHQSLVTSINSTDTNSLRARLKIQILSPIQSFRPSSCASNNVQGCDRAFLSHCLPSFELFTKSATISSNIFKSDFVRRPVRPMHPWKWTSVIE